MSHSDKYSPWGILDIDNRLKQDRYPRSPFASFVSPSYRVRYSIPPGRHRVHTFCALGKAVRHRSSLQSNIPSPAGDHPGDTHTRSDHTIPPYNTRYDRTASRLALHWLHNTLRYYTDRTVSIPNLSHRGSSMVHQTQTSPRCDTFRPKSLGHSSSPYRLPAGHPANIPLRPSPSLARSLTATPGPESLSRAHTRTPVAAGRTP